MPNYSFEAKSTDGKIVKGDVEAASEVEARVKIRAQQLMPLKIMAKQQAEKSKFATSGGSVTPKELQIFTRQFSVLIGAGVPIVDSLEALGSGGASVNMTKTVKKIVSEIEKGRRLAESLGNHPNVFDRMYVNLVKAGEEGGVLDEVLKRLATYIEKSVKMNGKVKGALAYPIGVIVIAIIVVIAILVFVVPKFVKMFNDAGKELPMLTQMVVDSSNFMVHYWYAVIAVCVLVPVGIKSYIATPEGKKNFEVLLIDMPLFGSLVQKSSIARFSRTLSTLLKAGVRIIDALDIAASTCGNYVIETNLLSAKDSISKGRTITEPLRKSKYIPVMVCQMIGIGEQTGALDTMLEKIADFYEDEVETAADALTSLIEPLLMVVLGGIISTLVIAMYLPIFDLAGNVGG